MSLSVPSVINAFTTASSENELDVEKIFKNSAPQGAGIWMVRLCELDAETSNAKRSLPAYFKKLPLPLLSRIASQFDKVPALVSEVSNLACAWRENVRILLAAKSDMEKMNACAFRLMIGKTVVSIDRLSRLEELQSSIKIELGDAIEVLRRGCNLSQSYEQIVKWFQPFQDLLRSESPESMLLDFAPEGIRLVSSAVSKTVFKPSEDVPNSLLSLDSLLNGVEGGRAINDLHNVELVVLYVLFNRLSLNYIAHQEKKIDFLPQIISYCRSIRAVLEQALNVKYQANPTEFKKLWAKMPRAYRDLRSVKAGADSLSGYSKGFLTSPVHISVLKQLSEDNIEIYRQLFVRASTGVEGVTFVDGDDDVGLRIYRLDARETTAGCSASKERLIVSIQAKELESLGAHYIPLQTKDSVFHAMGHAPVFEVARPLYERFKELIALLSQQDGMQEIHKLPITAIGFGLNGAAAQLLVYQWAKEHPSHFDHPKDGHICFGLGVPTYLERDSAYYVGKQAGLYSLNFVNEVDDGCLKPTYLSQAVSASYGESNFTRYPLIDKVSGVPLNLLGHQLSDYAYNIPAAVETAKSLYEHMEQVRAMEDKCRPDFEEFSTNRNIEA